MRRRHFSVYEPGKSAMANGDFTLDDLLSTYPATLWRVDIDDDQAVISIVDIDDQKPKAWAVER